MDNPIYNDNEPELVSGLKLLGLFELPEAGENDEKFIAYGMYVDSKPYLCRRLTKAQYEFSYFLMTRYAWESYLPENWKSWSLWDVVRDEPVCGSVRPFNEVLTPHEHHRRSRHEK